MLTVSDCLEYTTTGKSELLTNEKSHDESVETVNVWIWTDRNSGDLVQIVTDAALLLWDETKEDLDETRFWKTQSSTPPQMPEYLSPDTVVALTKCFILEWSN